MVIPHVGMLRAYPCMILAFEWDVKPNTLTFVILQTYYMFMGIKCFKNNLSTWALSRALIVSIYYWVKTY